MSLYGDGCRCLFHACLTTKGAKVSKEWLIGRLVVADSFGSFQYFCLLELKHENSFGFNSSETSDPLLVTSPDSIYTPASFR
jgi:hypothetical protein